MLCTDGLVSYGEVARRAGAEHRRIGPPRTDWLAKAKVKKLRRPGALGLGHVNAHHQRLKQFINFQAHGVSTRYLPDYLSCSRAVRQPGFEPILQLADTLIHRKYDWQLPCCRNKKMFSSEKYWTLHTQGCNTVT